MSRVTIRPVRLEDAPVIQRLVDDPLVTRDTRLPEPYPADGARRWLLDLEPKTARGEEYAFAIVVEGEGLVGVIGLADLRWEEALGGGGGRAEVGYWLGRDYWGRGYATDALRLTVELGFKALGLESLVAHVFLEHAGSGRVLEKSGFVSSGTKPSDTPKWPDRVMAIYRLTRQAWEQARASESSDRPLGLG